MTFTSNRRVLGTVATGVVWLLGVAFVSGQAGPAGQAARPQMSEDVFKNVQILKGIPVDEFMDTMGMFSAATGLNCTTAMPPTTARAGTAMRSIPA